MHPFLSEAFFLIFFYCLLFLGKFITFQNFYVLVAVFRFFMEKQIMAEFVRILTISRTGSVSLQLLQTMSIIIQNLKSEHAICNFLNITS